MIEVDTGRDVVPWYENLANFRFIEFHHTIDRQPQGSWKPADRPLFFVYFCLFASTNYIAKFG